MADHARSTSPAVQAQLDRLGTLSPGRDTLGLERIRALCARLGNPQDRLPPVFHVAGTNGKGSTCAFLRAMLEAAGHTVHVYTSPHLVRFNERIRLAGALISDEDLATTLARVLEVAEGLNASFFEVTTAAAFLRFSEVPADACVIEVGLGGRLDATNIIARPLVTGIASLGIDHKEFLLSPDPDVGPMPDLERIAFEKAGIAKRGVPLVTQHYAAPVAGRIAACADTAGATPHMRDRQWRSERIGRGFVVSDRHGKFYANPPALTGAHQADNAALAVAMLRAQPLLDVPETALQRGLASARWPARMQALGSGPLTRQMPGRTIWLDGGHNADAAEALAQALKTGPMMDMVLGMLANKDLRGFLTPIADKISTLSTVCVKGHAAHDGSTFAEVAAELGLKHRHFEHFDDAFVANATQNDRDLLVCGSLYLAGEVLRLNEELPA